LAGNLAHAVKTPLTVMANAAADPAVAPQSLRDTITTYTALAQDQVNWHMKRARMAASVLAPGALVQVRPVIEGIVAVMQRAYAEKSLGVEITVPATGLRFKGESQDLQEILGNVIENAFKWAQHRVRIRQETVVSDLVLIVEDDGPGVPAEQYSAVLRRGIRADEMVPGSGLGLAIVSDLLDLYGGQLALGRSALGGLSVRIALPTENVDHRHP
jgi:signal transduction histidine kinase